MQARGDALPDEERDFLKNIILKCYIYIYIYIYIYTLVQARGDALPDDPLPRPRPVLHPLRLGAVPCSLCAVCVWVWVCVWVGGRGGGYLVQYFTPYASVPRPARYAQDHEKIRKRHSSA